MIGHHEGRILRPAPKLYCTRRHEETSVFSFRPGDISALLPALDRLRRPHSSPTGPFSEKFTEIPQVAVQGEEQPICGCEGHLLCSPTRTNGPRIRFT
jgi:hypothetical protein